MSRSRPTVGVSGSGGELRLRDGCSVPGAAAEPGVGGLEAFAEQDRQVILNQLGQLGGVSKCR
jgi:hypothetical protein